jgi:hypothetical protein
VNLRLEMTGPWEHAREIERGALREAIRRGMARGIAKGAVAIQARIKKNIARGRPEHAALHPFTIAQKGSERPLVDHGDLLNGVSVQFLSELVAFIGVSRGARAKGQDLVSIAAVQEFGATIKVTPRMRAFLHAKGLHLKPSTKAIVIPPRPYVRPAWEEDQAEVEQIFRDEVQAEIGRLVGR